MKEEKISFDDFYAVVLLLVLALAAGVRFYLLDESALGAQEIVNASYCGMSGIAATANEYSNQTGLPAAYPTLLCLFIDGATTPVFLIRAFSASLGVAVVFIVYLLGRSYLSAATGLLASVLVALDFQGIFVDRSVTPDTFFTLLCLTHFYFFCQLLLGRARHPSPLKLKTNLGRLRCTLYWAPNCPCNVGVLLCFWLTSVLTFYTNLVVTWFFLIEMVAGYILAEPGQRNRLLVWLWGPVLIAIFFWFPRLYGMIPWVLQGNLFGMADNLPKLPLQSFVVPPMDASWFRIESLGVLLSIPVLGFLCYRGHYKLVEGRFFVLLLLLALTACVVLMCVKPVSQKSFLWVIFLMVLPIAEVQSFFIGKIRQPVFQKLALMACVLLMVYIQMQVYSRNLRHLGGGSNGFETAAKVIVADDSFMAGERRILVSSPLFAFYLEKYGVTRVNVTNVSSSDLQDISRAVNRNLGFYYLEYTDVDPSFSANYPAFLYLLSQYHIVCATRIPGFRITYFMDEPVKGVHTEEDCRKKLQPGSMAL